MCSAPPGVTVDVSRNRYADGDGVPLIVTEGALSYPSVAAVTYAGDGGEEEMHLFFTMAWFDLGSWAWAHYIAEWGTKGVFTVRSTTFAHDERRRPPNDTSARSIFRSYADEVPFKRIFLISRKRGRQRNRRVGRNNGCWLGGAYVFGSFKC